MRWMKIAAIRPGPEDVCDFLFRSSCDEPGIWMLCHSTIGVAEGAYEGTLVYWRFAEELPPGLDYESMRALELGRALLAAGFR